MGNAQLVAVGFGVAFAATGVGAPVGFLVGSIVGNLLFPPKAITSEGPRLGDLQISSSAYGAPRSIGFGTVRQGGNVIWSLPIKEKKKTTTISGGKGSMSGAPDQKQVTYSYFGTWAQAFGEGPANDVLRMWADGKIIFDKRSATTATQKTGLSFRFYPGSETQIVDPAIENDKGVGEAPAFRGTTYIVFFDVALADFGNRIPNITAEIAYAATDARISQLGADGNFPSSDKNASSVGVDWERGFMYIVDATGGTGATTAIRKYRLSDMQEVDQRSGTDSLSTGTSFFKASVGMTVLPNGDICTVIDDSGSNAEPIVLIDPNTLMEKARFGVGGSNTTLIKTGFAICDKFTPISMFGLTGRKDFVLVGSVFTGGNGAVGLLVPGTNSLSAVWSTDIIPALPRLGKSVYTLCGGKIADGEGDGYFMSSGVFGSANSTTWDLHRVRVKESASFDTVGGIDIVTGVEVELIKAYTPADFNASAVTFNDQPGIVYDQTDDTVLVNVTNDIEERWYKVNSETGAIIWTASEATAAAVSSIDTRWGNNSRLVSNTFGYIIGNNGFQLDTTTGEVLVNDTSPDYDDEISIGGHGAYDSITETFVAVSAALEVGDTVRFFFGRKTDTGVSIGTVVKNLIDRTGLDSTTDADTTDIDSTLVPGYLIGRQTSARAAITPVSTVFFFDGFESDYKLKFKFRGAAPVRTISQSEFSSLDKNGQVIKESRTQEVELPERFSLLYLDKDKDYLQNAHNAKRIKGPTPAMRSDNELGIDFPGTLTSDFAKQQAEKSLYTAWVERSQYQYRTTWKHMDLDPSDVITVALDNGQSFRTRIAQADIGVDYSIEMVAIGEEANQFISTVTADSGSGVPTQVIQVSLSVFGLILDVPLLRDQDEPTNRAYNPLYAAMGTFQEGQFTAGTVYKSADGGSSFTEETSFVSEMNWGTALNALADPVSVWQKDTVNTLSVQMTAGALELVSVTELEMLNGANNAALLKANGEIEVIQFQTVVVESDGTLTLSNLLRGRRGTDTMHTGHGAGERFLWLNALDMELISLTLAERNASRIYRSVGGGQLFDNGENQTLTSVHRALMPYSVQHQSIVDGASSSTDISWVRRTRVGGSLQDGFGTVPLSEDTEEYELEIYDGPGGTLVRTVTGITTPTYNYTSADQTTDGFTPPEQTLTIKVFQISAQVGRGFSEEVTVSV